MARKEKTIYLDPNKYKWNEKDSRKSCTVEKLIKKWKNKFIK